MKKEIGHLIGKDVIYEISSIVKNLTIEAEAITSKLDKVNELLLEKQKDEEMNEKLFCIQKNTEISQEFLSNEYVALSNIGEVGKTRLLICGFYGAKNVGDELMLEAILKLIPKDKFDITILLSNNYDLDASSYAPYKVLHYPKRSSDIAAIANSFDIVIWGGGAMLDDVEYEHRGQYSTITYLFMSITKAVLRSGGHALIYGVSSNSILCDSVFLDDLAFVVKNADYFSLRDSNSLQALKKAGIDVSKIDVIDDLSIYNLKGKTILDKENGKELNIGLNLILEEGRMEDYKSIISHISNYFDTPTRFTLIPFYNYQNHDQKILKQLMLSIGGDVQCEITKQPDNTEELLEIISECDYVFAMRYHAVLISALINKHTIMIDYQKKHRHYTNKNNYIKTKYLPKLLSVDYDELCKKGLSKNLVIPESGIETKMISVYANGIKRTIEKTLKAIGGNK